MTCLYEHHFNTCSARSLELLLSVQDPHEKYLCDRITDGLKQGGKARLNGLSVLGYIIRKQPAWLYKITQHSLTKELFKVLKHEEDLVIMMNALLDLVAMMPIMPTYISPYLPDLFDVFR